VPLVIGYLGFDVPIGVGGRLGSPIPTHVLLNDEYVVVPPAARDEFQMYETAAYQDLYDALAALAKQNGDAEQDLQAIDARVARFVPKLYPEFRVKPGGEELNYVNKVVLLPGLDDYLVYETERTRAIAALNAAAAANRSVKVAGKDESGEALRAIAQKLAPADDEQAAYEAALEQLRESLRSF
jgi:hypothetical protein